MLQQAAKQLKQLQKKNNYKNIKLLHRARPARSKSLEVLRMSWLHNAWITLNMLCGAILQYFSFTFLHLLRLFRKMPHRCEAPEMFYGLQNDLQTAMETAFR